MMTRPDVALSAALACRGHRCAALQYAARHLEAVATALCPRSRGGAKTRINRNAEALRIVTKASELVAGGGNLSKLDGDLAVTRGFIADTGGNFALALKNYQQAHDIFARLGIKRWQAIALLDLGWLYDRARDFDREVRYYREAAQVYSGDPAITLGATDNLGYAYLQMHRYTDAITSLEQALAIATSLKSPLLEETVLTNLALSYAGAQKFDEADRAADRSLAIVSKADPDGEARFVWGAKAEIEYRRGDLAAAAMDVQTDLSRHRHQDHGAEVPDFSPDCV